MVSGFAADVRAIGPANFLYADGELLFAHGHRRTRQDGGITPPGLTMSVRQCAVDRDTLPEAGVTVATEAGSQVLTLFASVPLSDEAWQPLDEGELLVVHDGEVVADA